MVGVTVNHVGLVLVWLLSLVIPAFVLYFIIKLAVKKAIAELKRDGVL